MRWTAQVPMRIDFAGGTLDVYPLYIFEGGGLTVNAAIRCLATATVESLDEPCSVNQFELCSQDLGCTEEVASLEQMAFGGPLDLVKRALSFYRPSGAWRITLHSEAPAGSGIGASSALLMALSACLNEVSGRGLDRAQMIDIGANIEAQVIGIPTGKQDYFPPFFGGANAIWFGIDGWHREDLSTDTWLVDDLQRCITVSYTGIPHSSAITNWASLKAYIEGEGEAVQALRNIKAIAQDMRDCLASFELERFADLLGREWALRSSLAEGIATPRTDAIMTAATEAGALANKLCGAGGGGCMITVTEPADKKRVQDALTGAGARIIDAPVSQEGIALTRTD